MRSEQEMFELILDTAKGDSRIRAVIMNGSRANPEASRDLFQDYDIVYIVTEVKPFRNEPGWIDRFGETMIVQTPDLMQDTPSCKSDSFTYLMQFADGNRIDLTLVSVAGFTERARDSLSLLLLDKDSLVKPFAPPTDSDYLPEPPKLKEFSDCCNEFWWVCPYVAKGLWREEILYAREHLDQIVRKQLMIMITWYAGVKTEFSWNPGKSGKQLQRQLEPELWVMLLKTYSAADYEKSWQALFMMCDLFRKSANRVATHFGFDYPQRDDERVSAHLKQVRNLPRDAQEIY